MRSGEDLRVGDRLGRYQLVRELGRGSMGLVFLAEDTMLHTPICVKVLHPALADHPEAAERFNREIVLARRISHKGVCRLHDIHREGELRFITMEFVEGQPLRDLLQNDSPKLGVAQVVSIGASMCDALAAAHDVGVVHRDLKPRNIMVRPNGEAAILDFGIATALDAASSLTLPGIALGTKNYIAPEVWAGRPATPQADQFAVGVILFNCLTRRMPFNAARDVFLLDEMSKGPPPLPSAFRSDVPPALDAVVKRALAFKPEARYADVRALRDALLQVEGHGAEVGRAGTALPPGVGASAPDPVTAVLPPTLPSLQAPTLVPPTVRSGDSPSSYFEPTLVSAMPLSGAASLPSGFVPSKPGFVPSHPDGLPPSDASWVVAGRAVPLPAVPKRLDNVAAPVVRGIADMIEPEVRAPPRRRIPMVAATILLGAASIAVAIIAFGEWDSQEVPATDAGLAVLAPQAAALPPSALEPTPLAAAPAPEAPAPEAPAAATRDPPDAAAGGDESADLREGTTKDGKRERRARKPTVDANRQRYLDAKGEVARAMAEHGLLAGDDTELDRLRQRAAQEAQQKSLDQAALTLAEAAARAGAVAIDRGFVDRKLSRFNSAFDKVTDADRRAAADAKAALVMSALAEKRYQDANDILNSALALVR